jgi:hypothetical protein
MLGPACDAPARRLSSARVYNHVKTNIDYYIFVSLLYYRRNIISIFLILYPYF